MDSHLIDIALAAAILIAVVSFVFTRKKPQINPGVNTDHRDLDRAEEHFRNF